MKYIHIKGEDNVVADNFSRLCDHLYRDEVAKQDKLTALFIYGDSMGSNAPTFKPRANSNSGIPVTTEPSIDPFLKSKKEAVHNSVSGHFGVEYARKVLLGRGVSDEGLRRAITKYVRECPVRQL